MAITLEQYVEQLYLMGEKDIFYYGGKHNEETKQFYQEVGYDPDAFDYHSTEHLLYDGLLFPALSFIFGESDFAESIRFAFLKNCIWNMEVMTSDTQCKTPVVVFTQKFLSICHFYAQTYYVDGLENKEILTRVIRCLDPKIPSDLILPTYSAELTEEQNIDSLYCTFVMVLYGLLHEYAHIFLGHLQNTKARKMFQCTDAVYEVSNPSMEEEYQADELALDWILKLKTEYTSNDPDDMLYETLKRYDSFPSIFTILELDEKRRKLIPSTHPPVHDRLERLKRRVWLEHRETAERLDRLQNYLSKITWKGSDELRLNVIAENCPFTPEDIAALNNELSEHEIEVGVSEKGKRLSPPGSDIISFVIYVTAGFFNSGGDIDLLATKIKWLVKLTSKYLSKLVPPKTPARFTYKDRVKEITFEGFSDSQGDTLADAIAYALTGKDGSS